MQQNSMSKGTLKPSVLSEQGHEFGFPQPWPKILSQILETFLSKWKWIFLHKVLTSVALHTPTARKMLLMEIPN